MDENEGVPHQFKFVTHIVPTGISTAAVEESTESGYEFQVIDELGADTMTLFRELLARMRRDLARRHLRRDEGGSRRIGDKGVVRARIDYDLQSDDRVPLLVIGGRR